MTKEIPDEKQQDLTEARMERCRPVVRKLMQELLDRDLLLADKTYIEQQVKGMLQALVGSIVTDHYNEVIQTLNSTIEHMLDEADKVIWNKGKGELTFSDFDKLFNEKKDSPSDKFLKDKKK